MMCINVLSGLICVGKSTYLEQLTRVPEFRDAVSVSLDEVGVRHWGGRTMTKTEKVYRNQLAREEVQRRIIVDGAENVLLEMVMLTRKNHQEPLIRIVEETERYLRVIEPERAALEGKELPEGYGTINLNVVLLYCSLDRVRERILRRSLSGDSYNSPVLSMEGVFDAAVQFELPEVYEPLPINTTEEGARAEQERMQEIMAFFLRGERPAKEVIRLRMKEAEMHLGQLQEEAIKAGITCGSQFLRSDYQKQ